MKELISNPEQQALITLGIKDFICEMCLFSLQVGLLIGSGFIFTYWASTLRPVWNLICLRQCSMSFWAQRLSVNHLHPGLTVILDTRGEREF